MKTEHPLVGNWRARLQEAVERHGHASLAGFLRANPARSYFQLAAMLDKAAAPIGISTLQFEEARKAGQLRSAAMDCLTRELNHHLPSGWQKRRQYDGIDADAIRRIDFLTASVYGDWITFAFLYDLASRPLAKATWTALKELEPPVGWLPATPEDSYLVKAFSVGWPEKD